MRPTLRDVARAAGVSVKTVSNVVNGYVHVSAETRSRVQRAIDALQYRPNMTARGLRSGRTGVLALTVPELNVPYFAELAGLVVAEAEQRGYTVLIDQTNGIRERELVVLGGIRDHLVDGVLLSSLRLSVTDLRERTDRTPLVLLGERTLDAPADHVGIDNVQAARDATRHLIERGCRRIAAIGAQEGDAGATAQQRLEGYRTALRDAAMPVDPDLVVTATAFHRAEGAAAMATLLDRADLPDGVFCFNDSLALGALRCLHTRGVRVPGQVALIGFDDSEEGRYSFPSLSTIAPDKQAIAEMSVALLVDRIAEPARAERRRLTAGYQLIARESTDRRAAGRRSHRAPATGTC
ncbi:MAG: LacI family DNA-binding transcriptional regulator [Actinocatenispora sp.]